MKTFEDMQKKMIAFRDERDWRPYHNLKDVALSISLEAAELLELFQWSGADTECRDKRDRMEEELADILLYCISFADVAGFDIPDILERKLEKNEQKYPVEKCQGKAVKYTELEAE